MLKSKRKLRMRILKINLRISLKISGWMKAPKTHKNKREQCKHRRLSKLRNKKHKFSLVPTKTSKMAKFLNLITTPMTCFTDWTYNGHHCPLTSYVEVHPLIKVNFHLYKWRNIPLKFTLFKVLQTIPKIIQYTSQNGENFTKQSMMMILKMKSMIKMGILRMMKNQKSLSSKFKLLIV